MRPRVLTHMSSKSSTTNHEAYNPYVLNMPPVHEALEKNGVSMTPQKVYKVQFLKHTCLQNQPFYNNLKL